MPHFDYIIVGQGLAGTVLAHTLDIYGYSVMIIDANDPAAASKVAAGIYNPVVPKRLAKSWKADQLLPVLNVLYPELEQKLQTRFFHRKRMIKPFSQEQEKVQWLKKCEEDVGVYLYDRFTTDDLDGAIYNPIGAATILQTGNLDTPVFLSASREYFRKKNALLEEDLAHAQLKIEDTRISYKDYTADKLIFCEGFRAVENPWFGKADYRLTKGEVLIVRTENGHTIPDDIIVNKGVFILPMGGNTYKVGATFDWNDRTQIPTEKAKTELIEKLEKILKVPFEIMDQQAGIRPTMNDRRPILGRHPEHPVLGIFNGLGTKGVMLAPYWAEHFVGFLEGRHQLDPEVDIARFRK